MLSTFVLFAIAQLLSSAVFHVESANPQPFVLDGVDVSIKDYPHAVAILDSTGNLDCGGSIIGEFSIITPRTCCDKTYIVKVGATDLSDAKSIKIDSCNNVAIDDDSEFSRNNEASVAQVSESLYKAGGKAVKLVQQEDIVKFLNKEGSVVGWGETIVGDFNSTSENQLKRADVQIVTLDGFKKLEQEHYPDFDTISADIDIDERYYSLGFSQKDFPHWRDFGAALTVETAEGIVAIGTLAQYIYFSGSRFTAYGLPKFNHFGHQRSKIDKLVPDVEWYEEKTTEDPKTPETTKTPEPTSSAFVSRSVFLALSFAFCAVGYLF